jgi:hypothetical protein
MQFLFHQLHDQIVLQIKGLKVGYASGTIDDWTYRHRRGMILDHYLNVTDRYGHPNLPFMTNRLKRLRALSIYLGHNEVLEEEQRMLLRSCHPPPAPALGRSIPLLPPPARMPDILQQNVGLPPPPPPCPSAVSAQKKQYEVIPPGNGMLVKLAKAFLDEYFLPYPKVAKSGGIKGRFMYRCKHKDCTMMCRLVPIVSQDKANPPLYVAQVKISCRVHTNHSAEEDEHLLPSPVRALGPGAKAKNFPRLSAAVTHYIDLLMEKDPKIKPEAIMSSLVGHKVFAELAFLTNKDRREYTLIQVRHYRRNVLRTKPRLPKSVS